MAFRKIGVVGAGTMGNGIAQAFAQAGFEVVMSDVAQAALDRAMKTIAGSYDRLIKKEKMTAEQKAAALGRIQTATEL
ncbi:MAG TPA: 3-hydroxyacyl-CoA dehydrogenase NAD-binding domain-containing protein, partial [Candidatus Desulfobacillus denitrificans]|nr:3-hydroxyacyl-CoA dehydrogenase NAD-binding domain-containing protein [Candidatus Desulfobacillus denitrificans]